MAGGGTTIEYSPTWMVAFLCAIIVTISLIVERLLHWAGNYFLEKDNKPLHGAIQKIKEELMLLGFISLLLTVSQEKIHKWCIPVHIAETWLPCKKQSSPSQASHSTSHLQTQFFFPASIHGRGLAESSDDSPELYCQQMGKAPLLSLTAVHHLHIFIFVLAVVHVSVCALTILLGRLKISEWKAWEKAIRDRQQDTENGDECAIGAAHGDKFLERGAHGWIHSFLKQFYHSVTEAEYYTMRRGFILAHCKEKPHFDFHGYIMRAFVDDFRKVIGINWFMWLFAVVFLLLNVQGFHTYFWVAFIPFLLLLAVGTKLEHVIAQLAEDVASNRLVSRGNTRIVDIKVSDRHFWFKKPKIVLILIHVLLFQNSYEIAFFFWIWAEYGFRSCIMGELHFLIPRLVLAVFIVFVCSYSTLPLYAIVTQMGSCYKEAILTDYMKDRISSWMIGARKRVKQKNKRNHGILKFTKGRLWSSSSGSNDANSTVTHSAQRSSKAASASTATTTTATEAGTVQLANPVSVNDPSQDEDHIHPAAA